MLILVGCSASGTSGTLSEGHVRHPTLPPGTAHLQQPGGPRVANSVVQACSTKWKDEHERLVYEDHEEFKEDEGYEGYELMIRKTTSLQ